MNKTRLLLVCLLFCLPALACSLFQNQDLDARATFVAGEIFATMTTEAPTATYTATAEATLPANDAQLPGPSTVHIAADGSGDYPSLEEALAAVPPESTIMLDPGTYRLKYKLEIDKSISLRGAGMDQTIVVGDDATYVIRFTGPGKFILQGITFRYEGTPWADVVSVKNGDIDFSDCSFTGGVYDDDEIKGGDGVITSGNTSGEIADCRSEDNGGCGFDLYEDSKLTLERNTCSNNSQVGIAYLHNSGGLAKENRCLNNGFNGISVAGQAQPTLERNTCSNNSQDGIVYWRNSGGLAKENNCLNNGLNGISVVGQAQPTLEGNTCQGNTYHGIEFDDNSGGMVRENQIMQNVLHGIRLEGDAAPTLESNIIKENLLGIAYSGNAGGTARQNVISVYLFCITVEEDANPELIDNSCNGRVTSEPRFLGADEAAPPANDAQLSGPSTVHIAADGSGDYPSLEEALAAVPPESTIMLDPGTYRLKHKLEIDKTISLRGAGMDKTIVVGDDATYVIRFTGPGKFTLQGITFRYEGTPWARVVSVKDGDIDFSDCSFTGGVRDDDENKGGSGLLISGNTSGEIADCRSEDNGLHGFDLYDDSNLTLERNTCSNNSQTGIVYWDNSGGLAKENNCLNNGNYGIDVQDQAQPILERNTCSNNSQAGIVYWDNSGGLAKENNCLNNGYNGIGVNEKAQPTLEGNTCQGNTYQGIRFDDNSGGVVRENQIMQNGRHGIWLGGDAAPTLESNKIKDNQENGIAYFGNAGGTARQNEISGNLKCITVGKDANPELIDNSCNGSATSEPTFGAITFARGESDVKPVDPATMFPAGIETVYACWDYWKTNPDLLFTRSWYNNGKEWFSESISWEHAENGSICEHIYMVKSGKGLPTGNWEVKLYIGNELAQSGKFKIGQ
jgi:parallel beta-helix repeat protein